MNLTRNRTHPHLALVPSGTERLTSDTRTPAQYGQWIGTTVGRFVVLVPRRSLNDRK
jgi:hypothetical protein